MLCAFALHTLLSYAAAKEMDEMAKAFEAQRRDLSQIIVHVDMDSFYAAVETLDMPKLAEVPMAVGSMSMLATSNYAARRFGVRAGMAGFIALKLCPQLTIVPTNFKKYQRKSDEVMEVLKEYDPNYNRMGLDEAYLNITDYLKAQPVDDDYLSSDDDDNDGEFDQYKLLTLPRGMWQLADRVVREMRQKVFDKTKLTCSAGIAHNKRLAKVCSDLRKPNNQYMLKATSIAEVENFLNTTQVRKIPGVGAVAEQELKALNIDTCRDLYEKRGLIRLLFSRRTVEFYQRIYLGVSSNILETEDVQRKSKSEERTFQATNDEVVLEKYIEKLARDVCEDLKEEGLKVHIVVIANKRTSHPLMTFLSIVRF